MRQLLQMLQWLLIKRKLMTRKTMIGNEEVMIISIRIPLLHLVLQSNSLKKLFYNTACETVTIFVYLPYQVTCQAVDLKGYLSDSSVIPWLFSRGITIILTFVSSSETTLTMNRMISGEEMMTIVTIASSSGPVMTIKTMISNKEMLTILGSSETMMTTIINQEITIVKIVSSSKAFAQMKTMIGIEEMMIFSIRVLLILLCLVLHSNCLPKWAYQTVTIFVYLPDYITELGRGFKGLSV